MASVRMSGTFDGNSLDSCSTVGHGVRRVPHALRPEHGGSLCPASPATTRGVRVGRVVVPVLVVAQAISVLTVYPYFLAYSGVLAAGREGHRRLSDSNVEWGQGRTFMQDEGIGRVNLAYFESARTGAYGIEYVALPISFRLSVPRICCAAEYPWLTVISAMTLQGAGVESVRAVPGERALRFDRAFSHRVRRERLKMSSSRSQLNGCLNRS